MTAPAAVASSAFSEISSNIAAIQATIAAIVGPAPTATSTTSASGTQFASELSSASDAVTANSSGSAGGVTGSAVVADAKSYLGVPYVWGGESRKGIDCSGLVQSTYHDLGISLPRTAAEQQKSAGTPVASLADAQPGDLLFFGQPAYHVAIYLGNNQLIESPEPGKTVHITDVYQTPTSIRRVVPSGGSTAASPLSTGGDLTANQLESAGLSPAVAAFASQFAAAETQYSLPTGLLAAVAQQESGGNAHALSSAGAQGLMQLMPATAAGMGVNANDPSQAIRAAAKILSSSLHRYDGSIPLALAAYNAGPGAVAKYGGIPPYTQTQNYVKDITAMMEHGG